jgi:hypothetical protein
LKLRRDYALATLAVLLNIMASVIYNWQMLKGRSSPNAASWGVWAFITLLNFTSYKSMSKDQVKSLLPTISSLLCIPTFILTIFRGRLAQLNHYDASVLVLGVIAGVVWWQTKSPTSAQALLQICIAVGFIPTYLGLWEDSHNELSLGWILWCAAFSLQILVVRLRWKRKYGDLMYPVNCLILHFIVILLIVRQT